MAHPELLDPHELDEENEQESQQESAPEVAPSTTPGGGNSEALEQSMAEITGAFGGAADHEAAGEVETSAAREAEQGGDTEAAQAKPAEHGPAAPAQSEAGQAPGQAQAGAKPKAAGMDEARRQRLLRGQYLGLLDLYRKGTLDEGQVIEKMIAYDRKLNGGEVSVEGTAMIPSLFAAMSEQRVKRAKAQAAAKDTAAKTGGRAGDASNTDAADDAEEAVLTEQVGKAAGGGNEVKSEGGAPKTNATSGGAKKTSGPKDLVETYGTVDEIKRKDLTEDVKVYFVEGLKKKGKKKTKEERDDVDQLPMLTKTTPVHKKAAPLFREIFEEIRESGDWKNILEHPWAYNPRQNRNNPTEWSIHSFGTAIDVNATTNPNDNSGASKRQKEISHYFTDRGFTWLEDSDAMHFQYHNNGAPKITDDEIDQIKDDKHSGTNAKELTRDIKKALGKAQGRLATEQKKKKPRAKEIARLEARILRMNEMLERLGAGGGGGGGAAGGAAGAAPDKS